MSYKDLKAYQNPDLTMSIEDRIRAVQYAITEDPDYDGWDTKVLQDVKLISAAPGRAIFEMTVTPSMCNKGGNLHGGCATTILDNLSSTTMLTIASKGFLDAGHVSRTINMTFIRAVPAGTKVRIVAETVAAGKRLAHCKAQIETLDGNVAVTCTHDKAIIPRANI